MKAACINTRRGLRAWLARQWELLNVTLTLRWAEDDREQLEDFINAGPRQLRRLNAHIEELRARQERLRG